MNGLYERYVKRLLDIVLSVSGLIILALPMLVIAAAVKLDTPGPVLFRQRRIGKDRKEFMMLKFRTMPVTAPHDTPTHLLDAESVQLSVLQRFLRRSSCDELPQLVCIAAGHMSVVGPRPALWNQYDLIALREENGANGVRPGLTGWAQINGRDELPIDVKAAYDGEYVKNLSFLFDCKCFFGTVGKVLCREGVVEGGTGEGAGKREEQTV